MESANNHLNNYHVEASSNFNMENMGALQENKGNKIFFLSLFS